MLSNCNGIQINALSAALVHQTSNKLSCRNPMFLGASASSRAFLRACYHIMVLVSTIMYDTSVLKISSEDGLGYSTWKYRLLHQYLGHSQVFSKFG